MAGQAVYEQAGALQRGVRRFAASGPGSWIFARVAHHIDRPVFRLTGGRHTFATLISGLPIVMLTTTGARSGLERTVPVVGLPAPDGLAVIASSYGQKNHPGWYHNLRANPAGRVSINGSSHAVHASEAQGALRERIWQEALKVYPGFSTYERRATHRKIAVFLLQEVEG